MPQAKETGKTVLYLRSEKKLCHWGIARDKNGTRKDQRAGRSTCCCLALLWALGLLVLSVAGQLGLGRASLASGLCRIYFQALIFCSPWLLLISGERNVLWARLLS